MKRNDNIRPRRILSQRINAPKSSRLDRTEVVAYNQKVPEYPADFVIYAEPPVFSDPLRCWSSYLPTGQYHCKIPATNICHVVDNLGVGGAQTLTLELASAIERYYPKLRNHVLTLDSTYSSQFAKSYGIQPIIVSELEINSVLADLKCRVVVQHRTSGSKPLTVNAGAKYVVVNHTVGRPERLSMFGNADFIVAACEYLHRSAIFPESLPRERTTVILDGVEDNYVAGIPAKSLPGDFRSGRCHRLVRGKFRLQSIKRIEQLSLPRHKHYILGFSEPAKAVCRTTQSCVYVGPVVDRLEKIAHLKSFHVYYYETYMHEGPGMALLESLACGVPAVCLNWGGITEVIKDKVNGLVLNDTNKITESLRLLQQSPDLLSQLSKGATADFQDRLHVRHTASKYAQLFEHIL